MSTEGKNEVQDRKKSWDELRDDVRNIRRRLWGLGFKPPHSFTFRKMNGKTRIYFMSSPPNSRENSLHAIDVPDSEECRRNSDYTTWIQILQSGFQGANQPSKEEQLMMERKRMTPTGIGTYEFHEPTAKFVFTCSSSLYECIDLNTTGPLTPKEISTPHTSGARLNAEICPNNSNLIAFVNNGDLWVVNTQTGQEEKLTHSHKGQGAKADPISSGLPNYIIQEEFNRFHGFWWNPESGKPGFGCNKNEKIENDNLDGTYRILYEEVDESKVNIVTLMTLPGKDPEEYRFPFAGSSNAKSTLRFVEFSLKDDLIINIRNLDLFYPISQHFPWAEYIVRAGWTPDGLHVWAQLLHRSQKRLELVLFPYTVDFSHLRQDDPTLQALLPSAPAYVIYSETTNIWTNVNDMLTFLPCDEPNAVCFIWASEETGFRHIYIIKSELRPALTQPWWVGQQPVALCLSPLIRAKLPITRGNWEVVNAQMALHYNLGFLFFIGLADTPIERHLYVVDIHNPGDIRRLTNLDHSYSASFNNDCSMVILTYSSTKDPPVCQLFSIKYANSQISGITFEPITFIISRPMVLYPEIEAMIYPDICTYYQNDSGQVIYSMIYRPFNFVPGKKYPTILNIYGGPEVQLVTNSFKGSGQLWLYLLASQGYCVVAIDSRGSHHRGVEFESHIRNRMGTVELKDQVEVLLWLAQQHNYIDMSRVGLYGWSYGGYLSLMGLAHYPNLFKVAVAGAPVTSWELYDTGYTERYMEQPENNPQGYKEGSIMSYIQQFPDEEDRLLIVHGLVDENVHFVHTAQFVDAMIKAGKPYQLQLYPTERHSLRRIEASEHYETMLLSFLQRCL